MPLPGQLTDHQREALRRHHDEAKIDQVMETAEQLRKHAIREQGMKPQEAKRASEEAARRFLGGQRVMRRSAVSRSIQAALVKQAQA